MKLARKLGRCRHCWGKLNVVQVRGLYRAEDVRLCARCDDVPPALKRFYYPSHLDG